MTADNPEVRERKLRIMRAAVDGRHNARRRDEELLLRTRRPPPVTLPHADALARFKIEDQE